MSEVKDVLEHRCIWGVDRDDGRVYDTACNEFFMVNDGSLWENGIKYCPFCGRQIIVAKGEG